MFRRSRAIASAKPGWPEGQSIAIVGEGFFFKNKAKNVISSWKKRSYKIRADAVLFYFEESTCKGSVDLTEFELSLGNDKNLDKRSISNEISADSAVCVELLSISEETKMELVFDSKASTDAFCVALTRVSSKHNVEQFVTDFHWKEANRGTGAADDFGGAAPPSRGSKLPWKSGAAAGLKVVGDGAFWKKGHNVKNWKRRAYKVREDGVLFYFDGENLKGQLDLQSVKLSIGDGDGVDESGAADFTTEDAIPVDLRSNVDRTTLQLVFDSKTSCDVLLLTITRVTTSHNIKDFLSQLQQVETELRNSTAASNSSKSVDAPGVTVVYEGMFCKRGRVRDTMKKRVFRMLTSSSGGPHACIEYSIGYNNFIHSTIPISHSIVQFEDKNLANPSAPLNFADGEYIGISVTTMENPVSATDGGATVVKGTHSFVFIIEGISDVEKFCENLAKISISSNIPTFVSDLRKKTITREKAERPVTVTPKSIKSADFLIVYEGVFIGRGTLTKTWKSRNFRLRKSSGGKTEDGTVALLDFDVGVLGSTKIDISDVTLGISSEKSGPPPQDGFSESDYTIIDIKSKTEKQEVVVAFIGRSDVEKFCEQLTKICRTHNVNSFLQSFRTLPQGDTKIKREAIAVGSFIRKGAVSKLWSRKVYRISRVEDSNSDPVQTYGLIQYGEFDHNFEKGDKTAEELHPRLFSLPLRDVSISIDSAVCKGSHVITITPGGVKSENVPDDQRAVVLILDPWGVQDATEEDDEEDNEIITVPAPANKGKEKREHPTAEEIITFLRHLDSVCSRSNTNDVIESFRKQNDLDLSRDAVHAILFPVSGAIFGFVSLWVFWSPTLFSLFIMCISFLFFGVFMGTIYKRNCKATAPI